MKHSILCARTLLIIFTLLTVNSVHSFAETAHPSFANSGTEVANAIATLPVASPAPTKEGSGRQPVQVSPAMLGWSPAGSMSVARVAHTATLLQSGRVLVTGGQDSSHNALASAELYDPNSNSWSSAGSMNIARWLPTATLLTSGKVLVAGGACGYGCATESVELYDPNTNSWSTAPSMGTARYNHTATLLSSGDVLIAGGGNASTISLATAELFNAASNTWSPAGQMAARRYGHTSTLLPSGHVLVAGGGDINANSLARAELYDGASNKWSPAGSMNTARYSHEAALLLSGNVLVVGGYRWANGNYSHLASAEIYDAHSNTWSSAASMTVDRMGHTATSLLSGKVLVAGGVTYGAAMSASAEIYDPGGDTWSLTGNMSTERESHTATLLPSGQVLVAGGAYGQKYRATAELYNPGGTISGRMTDAASEPLADVTISTASGGSATTDGNGAYTISGLAAGTYTLTPSKSGYTFSPTSRTVTVPPDATGQDFVATPAVVAIDALEITQGIQCLNDAGCFGVSHSAWCTTADCTNAVPLVVNKPTFVRLYVRSQQAGTRVTALLKGYYQNGEDLPGSPLLSPSVISAHVDGGDHGNADDSLNFRLPAAWTLQDNITVEPRLYLAGGESSVDSRQLALAFSDRNAMPVFSWRFRFPTVAAATDTEVRTATQFAAQTYPISADVIDLRDQGEFATNARNWSQLTAELAKSCNDAKRRSGYSETRCYGWVPQGVTIQSSDGHTYYGWTANGVSVGYVYRPPLAGGVENLAPQYIFAHEIGHTFWPVAHVATATCGGAGGGQFETQFPNTSGSIGQYGFYDGQVYQPNVVLPDHPTSYFDVMSYCGVNSNRQWISPYTYRHLFDALGSPDLARAASAPAASQPYLIVSGVITPTVTATINSIYGEEYPTGSYDGQGSGTYRLELQDSQGAVLFTRYFDQSSPEWPDPTTAPVDFFEIMPFTAGTAKLVVKQDTTSLAEVAASANAPQVALLEPAPGPVTGETLQISWTADDADDDQLTFAVEYSTDNGATWQTLAFDLSETSLTVKTTDLPGSSQAKVRVLASDGFNTTTAESGVLEVPVKTPHVTIVAPAQGALLTPGQPVHLSGIAQDCEDGPLYGAAVTWTLDGSTTIGSGTQLTLLDPPAGQHTITFTAQDSTGSTASTGVDVFVGLQETTFPVSIAVATASATLIWDHTTAPITGYSVYRSSNPYFMPGSDDAQLMVQITPPGLGGQVAYTDNTAFDSLSTFYAYAVCGAYGGDPCAMRSTTTGVFNFMLTPGTLP